MKIAIIGSSGPLGSYLKNNLRNLGNEVTGFSRSGFEGDRKIDVLREEPPSDILEFDAVIYSAWDTLDRSVESQRRHAEAAIGWANRICGGTPIFVFVSTTLADSKATSNYGFFKFKAEEGVRRAGGTAIRVGLVCDDSLNFLATKFRGLKLRELLMFALGRVPVFAVSSKAVGIVVSSVLKSGYRGECFWLAGSSPTEISEIVRYPNQKRSISLPYQVMKRTIRPLTALKGGVGPIDRLLGLVFGPQTIPLAISLRYSDQCSDWSSSLSEFGS